MSVIDDFSVRLRSKGSGVGAEWMKADFHIHEPESSDYEYKGDDAVAQLGCGIRDAGYRFAVILKHQEFPSREELHALQAHCPNTTLIPGAEINVLVDALFKKIGKDYFFHCIVAVDPDSEAGYNYVLEKAKENLAYRLGEYPAGFRSSILDLGRFFRKNGALFIPAHLHQAKSAENSRSIDDLYDDDAFLGFVSDGAFDALEVRQLGTAAFFTGQRQTNDGRLIPAAVCVTSTDAHHHKHLTERNRATWIRAERATFDELKAALDFRHRVTLQKPEAAHARILGVHVKGSFISETWIQLNDGLNALIGAKGSGKTALVECIRFALNTHVPSERKEAVGRHIAHVLGSSGYVECLVENIDGRQMLITRRSDSRDRISIVEKNGEARTLSAKDEIDFPISILGWHEIEAVADQAEARISLLDRTGNAAEIKSLYEKIGESVEQARDLLPSLQRQVKRLETSLREMWELQRKRKTLQRLEQGELMLLQQQYEWFLSAEQKIVGLQNSLKERSSRLPELIESRISLGLSEAPDAKAAAVSDAIADMEGKILLNTQSEEAALGSLQGSLQNLSDCARNAAASLAASFASFRDEVYTPKVNALPPEDREILTKQIQVLEETKRLPLLEKQCDGILTEVRSLASQIKDSCDSIITIRNSVSQKRTSLVSDLNSELPAIQLRFLPYANPSWRNAFQRRYPEEGAALVGYVQQFGKTNPYENLSEVFRKLRDVQLEQDKWDVDKALLDVKFVDMLDVFDDDDVEIKLNVGNAGYVPIQNLSAGQRCVAVFPLLLRNSKGPLIIDQPEDNLDNRHIADVIAPDLLERKKKQQFLVTSHNANLVVLTDADLVIHMDSDGTSASFPAVGFFASSLSRVRKSVLDVLDGGEAALTARQRKYGTRRE